MSDTPDNVILTLLRRMDMKLDRLVDEVQDLKRRTTPLDRQAGDLRVDLAGVSARLDRIDDRLVRVERRLDLRETPEPTTDTNWPLQ